MCVSLEVELLDYRVYAHSTFQILSNNSLELYQTLPPTHQRVPVATLLCQQLAASLSVFCSSEGVKQHLVIVFLFVLFLANTFFFFLQGCTCGIWKLSYESELQLLAYDITEATQDLSCICDPHCNLQQCWIPKQGSGMAPKQGQVWNPPPLGNYVRFLTQ